MTPLIQMAALKHNRRRSEAGQAAADWVPVVAGSLTAVAAPEARLISFRTVALLLFCAAWLTGGAGSRAALPPGSFDSYESRSRQFTVTGVKPGTYVHLPAQAAKSATNYLMLETGVVAVNCERIKDALLRELGTSDQWRGKIRVQLMPDASPDAPITVYKEWFSEHWQFTLYAPQHVEPARFVRGVVWALLLEQANRNNPTQTAAEIPLWLVEGLTTQLLTAAGAKVIMAPRTLTMLNVRAPDAFREARVRFKQQPPLSFSDLSMPSAEQVSGEAWENFRCSSHVFVAHLLNLREGRGCLVETTVQLQNFLNPQLAFLQAYRGHFQSVLDVEKWWSVSLVNFTGRDQHLRWGPGASLQRLDELMHATVELRTGTNALPKRAEVSLQRLLEQTEYANHRTALAHLTQQLMALQWNAPPDLSKLVNDYRMAIVDYLQKREKAARDSAPSHKLMLREVIQQLDLLDVIREDFRKADLAEVEAATTK